MKLVTTNSKVQVEIIPASFKDAINLKKAAFECLKEEGILKGANLADLSNIELGSLLDKFLSVLMGAEISTNFENALFDCLKSCTIENDSGVKNKITLELFDENHDLRADYYEIVAKCVEVNLRPFLKSLVSEFLTRFATEKEDSQE